MYRISDRVQAKVIAGIKALGLPAGDEEQIGWDINPILLSRPGAIPQLGFVVGISVPVPATEDDFILHLEPLADAHAGQETVTGLIAKLYGSASSEAREQHVRITVASNGEKRTEGGLVIPE